MSFLFLPFLFLPHLSSSKLPAFLSSIVLFESVLSGLMSFPVHLASAVLQLRVKRLRLQHDFACEVAFLANGIRLL